MAKILNETFQRDNGRWGYRSVRIEDDGSQTVLSESPKEFPTEHAAARTMQRAVEGRRSEFKPLGD